MKASALLDILFPRACASCGERVADESLYICWNCMLHINVIQPPLCDICGNPVAGMVENSYICRLCKKRPFFDIARSAVNYTGIMKDIIQCFKYQGATWLAEDLASLILTCFRVYLPVLRIDAVVSVPLHSSKQRKRAYNQSELLAKKVAASLRLPVYSNKLRRLKQTISQTHLTAFERRANVKGAFAVKKDIRFNGLDILLIDDVMTTGATLNDCARALKLAGAQKITALTVARG